MITTTTTKNGKVTHFEPPTPARNDYWMINQSKVENDYDGGNVVMINCTGGGGGSGALI